MLILISDAFDKSLPDKLKVFGEVTDDTSRLSEADIVLIRSKTKATREYIDQAKNMKLIIRGGVGMDNIDRAYCREKGIISINTPKASGIAVAELAFGKMLAVASNLQYYDRTMKNGEWTKKTKRHELYGKTLCCLGIGNIASQLAMRAKAFGMNVVAYDKYVKMSPFATLLPTVEEAVAEADYISIHLPLNPDTEGMFNKRLFDCMKKSPVIINTGRGKIINDNDMVDALKDGRVGHFSTDVYTVEPPTAENCPYLGLDNVTVTPHVGANSVENLLRIGDEVYATIQQFVEGKLCER